MKKILVHTPFIKLDAFLKLCGSVISGGAAKESILAGKVTVNGESELRRGRKLYPGDKVEFSGEEFKVEAQ